MPVGRLLLIQNSWRQSMGMFIKVVHPLVTACCISLCRFGFHWHFVLEQALKAKNGNWGAAMIFGASNPQKCTRASTILHISTIQFSTSLYDSLQISTILDKILCYSLQVSTILYNSLQNSLQFSTKFFTILNNFVQTSRILYKPLRFSTNLYNSLQFCTILYNSIQFSAKLYTNLY